MPEAGRGDAYANALRNSGAARMLLPHRVHRAGYADAVESAQQAVGTVGNPVIGLAVVGTDLVVTFTDGTTESLPLPAGMGGTGVDQTARDAAAAAQADADTAGTAASTAQGTADSAQGDADAAQADIDGHEANHPLDGVQALIDTHAAMTEVHHRRSSSAGIVNVENGRLASNDGTVMRIGWSNTQDYAEQVFTRDGNHPDDGAAVGTIAGVFPPVQPGSIPAIPDVAANEKYLHIWVGEIPGNVAQLTFFGAPAHGVSAAAAQTYNTTDGTWWVSNLPLSSGISAYAFSATVVGVLIASRPWVTEYVAANSGGSGGAPTAVIEVGADEQLATLAVTVYTTLLTVSAADLTGGLTYLVLAECDSQMGFSAVAATNPFIETHLRVRADSTDLFLDRERTSMVGTSDGPRHSHSHFTTWVAPGTPGDMTLQVRWIGPTGMVLSAFGFAVSHSRLFLMPVTTA